MNSIQKSVLRNVLGAAVFAEQIRERKKIIEEVFRELESKGVI